MLFTFPVTPLRVGVLVLAVFVLARTSAWAEESSENAVCRMIENAAKRHVLPVSFLTRLIWRESSFRSHVTSAAGAQGVAQFMPGTAQERGLADPFDPEQAIPKAAELLAELKTRFGNLGLAAAAYNAGPQRVDNWLSGQGGLPLETRDYVVIVTKRTVEEWKGKKGDIDEASAFPAFDCHQSAALMRRDEPRLFAGSTLTAPWGVQIAGSFNKRAALAAYARARREFAAILGDVEPMVLGGRLRSRGFAPFYRVRAPAYSRAGADALCAKIMRRGGACAVLKS